MIVKIIGLPKSGKTTTATLIRDLLEDIGAEVEWADKDEPRLLLRNPHSFLAGTRVRIEVEDA